MGMHFRLSFAASYAFITQTMNMFMHMRPKEMFMQHIQSFSNPKIFQNHCQITVFFLAELYTFFILFIIFCVLRIFEWFFFIFFYNTLNISNPEFQNFPVCKSIAIRKNSKHFFRNRWILIGIKNRMMN